MSFILDALRKSENSRLRQDHPAIFTTPMSRQRPRLPRWVLVLAVLLIVNLLFVGYALWRDRPDPTPATPKTAMPAPASAAVPDAAPAPAAMAAADPEPRAAARLPRISPTTAASATPALASRDDLLARGTSLPPAELNLHVYDPNPAARFVLLNGQRLREGEVSREGLTVERITPEGVVLRFGNASFAVTLQ